MHACTHKHTQAHTHTHACTHARTHARTHTHTHTHRHTHTLPDFLGIVRHKEGLIFNSDLNLIILLLIFFIFTDLYVFCNKMKYPYVHHKYCRESRMVADEERHSVF